MAFIQYNSEATISGQYLEDFLRILDACLDEAKTREARLLSQRTRPENTGEGKTAKRYKSDMQDAGLDAHLYEYLSEKVKELAGEGEKASVSGRQITDLILSYRGLDSSPVECDSFPEVEGRKPLELKGTPDQQLMGLYKIGILHRHMTDFMELLHLQQGKMDEYICSEILRLNEHHPDFCHHGALNLEALAKHTHIPQDGQDFYYLKALEKRQRNPRVSSDIFRRAQVEWHRFNFERTVAEDHPGLSNHALQEKQREILRKTADDMGLDLNNLLSGRTA